MEYEQLGKLKTSAGKVANRLMIPGQTRLVAPAHAEAPEEYGKGAFSLGDVVDFRHSTEGDCESLDEITRKCCMRTLWCSSTIESSDNSDLQITDGKACIIALPANNYYCNYDPYWPISGEFPALTSTLLHAPLACSGATF